MRVEARADGGAADSEIVEAVERNGNAATVTVEQTDPAGKFLAEGERCGVLQMRAADFYDIGELFSFGVERIAEFFDGGEKAARGFGGGGDVHGGGKGVVGGLRHIYVVIGMNRLLAAHYAAGNFDGAIGDDFVDVHVGLRTASRLPDAQREMLVELAGDDFVSGLRDKHGFFCGKFSQILIY